LGERARPLLTWTIAARGRWRSSGRAASVSRIGAARFVEEEPGRAGAAVGEGLLRGGREHDDDLAGGPGLDGCGRERDGVRGRLAGRTRGEREGEGEATDYGGSWR
jgi:hypothetical protein